MLSHFIGLPISAVLYFFNATFNTTFNDSFNVAKALTQYCSNGINRKIEY